MKFFDLFTWPKFRTHVVIALATLFGLILLGTLVYHYLENWTWISCFYFSVTTLTTVGYGDLAPSSDGSRLFTAFYVLAGVSLALMSLTVIGNDFLERQERQEKQITKLKVQKEILKPRMQEKFGKK